MKRSPPPARKTPLSRAPMKRSPHTAKAKAPRPKRQGKKYPLAMVNEVRERSGGLCELMHPGCRKIGTAHHHRHMQGQGGPDVAGNILWLCSHCHNEIIHRHTGWAYRHGLLVRSWRDALTTPIVLGCGVACLADHVGE